MSIYIGSNYRKAKTAKEVLEKFPNMYGKNGYYYLYPNGSESEGYLVYCDMTTDGGGWMLISRSHPSVINYNGTNWGWRGNKIGNVDDFSQAYQMGWYSVWDNSNTFDSFLVGNRSNINNNEWGPFIYKISNINYSLLINDNSKQSYTRTTLKSDISVYGNISPPGMQGVVGFSISGTNSNIYYMRDCCGFSIYGGVPTRMVTTYCGANFYYSGPWCGGSSIGDSGNFLNGTYVSNNLTYGGTNQYMIFVK